MGKSRKHSKKKKKDTSSISIVDGLDSSYTNDDNPFGDSNLTTTFIWKKKLKQDEKKGISKKKHKKSKEERKKIENIKRELEKAKSRRELRELEKRQWEEQMSLLDRERNQLQSEDWQTRELSFHLIQAKKRSEIRIKEGRAKSIDWLYQWVILGYSNDKDNEHERQKLLPIYNPCNLIPDLSLEQLYELVEDINVILSTKTNFTNAYENLLELCKYEIDKRKGHEDIIKSLHNLGVYDLFKDKSSKELIELQNEIKTTLNSGGAIDVAYWETLLKASHIFKIRAILTEMHLEILEKRAELFKELLANNTTNNSNDNTSQVLLDNSNNFKINYPINDTNQQTIESLTNKTNEDRLRLLEENAEQLYNRSKPESNKNILTTDDLLLKHESEKGMDENEEEFTTEVDLAIQKYAWNDLYRPRKPKYYNRIKTGYEWNKYNQTHYDHDNPPPKVIQGYKFNIFYPDLIDKTKSPTFYVQKTDEDTTIIRFHAGPPYEDIAFRIVNKEWETSHRKGHRCVFDRGVLQLYFNFKRYKYRR